jgi:hypothetical protein
MSHKFPSFFSTWTPGWRVIMPSTQEHRVQWSSPSLEAQCQPPFLLLKSALEFQCSQCISLEGCPPRVAMVTVLVLHARKSRGTCWSHHQNLSLKNQQMAFVRNSYFSINLGKKSVQRYWYPLTWTVHVGVLGKIRERCAQNPQASCEVAGHLVFPEKQRSFVVWVLVKWKLEEDHDNCFHIKRVWDFRACSDKAYTSLLVTSITSQLMEECLRLNQLLIRGKCQNHEFVSHSCLVTY